ncbi:MAG: hypothetical protein JXB13_02265 [Phycisphaerae bacterium]|nr:hypothetical protein [Phycisphaerae bacterium]
MKVFGGMIRSVLNINFIWGIMILASFVLCLVQHIQDTTSRVDPSLLADGANTLAVYVGDFENKDAKPQRFTLTLDKTNGQWRIPDSAAAPSDDRPWLIAARPDGQALDLTWDFKGHGDYLLSVERPRPLNEPIPEHFFRKGENTILVRQTSADAPGRTFAFHVKRDGDDLSVSSVDAPAGVREPHLEGARLTEDGFVLDWQDCSPQECSVIIEQRLAVGKLVTLKSLTDAAFEYATKGFEIALKLVAAMVMLLGLMKVGEKAGIIQLVAGAVYPVIRFLFPQVPKDHPANGAIVMNVTSTLLGLGNAATPFGLKAMKELQSLNDRPEVATDSQIMLLGYNTAGLAILPATLLSVRNGANCSDPTEVIGTCMLAGAVATVTAIVMVKLLGRLPMFSREAAVAEYERDQAEAARAAGGKEAGS